MADVCGLAFSCSVATAMQATHFEPPMRDDVHGYMQMIFFIKLAQFHRALDRHEMKWEWNADRGYSMKWITLPAEDCGLKSTGKPPWKQNRETALVLANDVWRKCRLGRSEPDSQDSGRSVALSTLSSRKEIISGVDTASANNGSPPLVTHFDPSTTYIFSFCVGENRNLLKKKKIQGNSKIKGNCIAPDKKDVGNRG